MLLVLVMKHVIPVQVIVACALLHPQYVATQYVMAMKTVETVLETADVINRRALMDKY
jgi:hypothetical protein